VQNAATKFLLENDILKGNKLVLVFMEKCVVDAADAVCPEKGKHLKMNVYPEEKTVRYTGKLMVTS
jgi:hypothetical protein